MTDVFYKFFDAIMEKHTLKVGKKLTQYGVSIKLEGEKLIVAHILEKLQSTLQFTQRNR